MNDITAVVLSTGEPYTERAIASVERQTLPAAEIIVVSGVSPFHRALNHGAAQVRTPFLVQVDADVILDDTCFAELRSRVNDDLGLVSALLRDPIVGRTQGIRLYRTQCFAHAQIRNSISPDMDFGVDIRRQGWGRLYVLRYDGVPAEYRHTLGDHQPDYTLEYTFRKFVLEGARARYRRHEGRVHRMFESLRASRHDAATIAVIGVAHGLFLRQHHDMLVPHHRLAKFDLLEAFLAAQGDDADPDPIHTSGQDDELRMCFRNAYELGARYRRTGASSAFLARLRCLMQQNRLDSWLTLVGMCHGLFHQPGHDAEADDAYASLAEILAQGAPW